MKKIRTIIIMGAAGRDFHNFNVCFRDNPNFQVAAFTAEQIPGITGRRYPTTLAGDRYPKGIPIYAEKELPELIKTFNVDEVILAYSDLSYQQVMQKSAIVNAAGADFRLMGVKDTMLQSKKAVIAVCAVRTGAGKSQTARMIGHLLRGKNINFVVVRHPMPYGELQKQQVQRFSSIDDLDRHECTIEEREEYEPHLEQGNVVYAGVDYARVLHEAEKEVDIIVWDGGNNDVSFFKPDLLIVLTDALRPGHEVTYYPGEVNLRLADVIIINKVDSAPVENVDLIRNNIRTVNPRAMIIEANSVVTLEKGAKIRGKRVLVIEDGPTLTHGNLSVGAGYLAAKRYGAEVIDPRPYAVGSIKQTFQKYPHLESVLPAMGYSNHQCKELAETINAAECDVVVLGTPMDLSKVVSFNKPTVRIRYDLVERGEPKLEEILHQFLETLT